MDWWSGGQLTNEQFAGDINHDEPFRCTKLKKKKKNPKQTFRRAKILNLILDLIAFHSKHSLHTRYFANKQKSNKFCH